MRPPGLIMLSAIAVKVVPRPALPSLIEFRPSSRSLRFIANCSSSEVPKAANAGFLGSTWPPASIGACFVGRVNGGFMITRSWLRGATSISISWRLPFDPSAICRLIGSTTCCLVDVRSSSSSEPMWTMGCPFGSRSSSGLPSVSLTIAPLLSLRFTPPNG